MVKTSTLWDVPDKKIKGRVGKLAAMPEEFIKGIDRFIGMNVPREYIHECVDRLVDTAFLAEPDGSEFVDLPLGDKLELNLAEIPLDLRYINSLEEAGILLVGELLRKTASQIKAIPNIDCVGLSAIYRALEDIGICRPPKKVVVTNGFISFQAMCKHVGEVRE